MSEIFDAIKNARKLIGAKQVLRELPLGSVSLVVLSADADEPLKSRVEGECFHAAVPLEYFPSKAELGALCGIDVAAAVVGILRE